MFDRERTESLAITFTLRHIQGTLFELMEAGKATTSLPANVLSPDTFPVEGERNSNLLKELRWYFEDFLVEAYRGKLDSESERHAEHVRAALQDWGEQAYRALFHDLIVPSTSAPPAPDTANAAEVSYLHLQIASDDPQILAWPWEAICHPEAGFLGQIGEVSRCTLKTRQPLPLTEGLPKSRANILMIVARPKERDIPFCADACTLLQLIENEGLPANLELLRPPTFNQLREHLRKRPGFYHVLHFDVHGDYSEKEAGPYRRTEPLSGGRLIFENNDAERDPVAAEQLSALLKECAVPAVVLNSCQSAMMPVKHGHHFLSVAMALLRAGVGSVVAMAYSVRPSTSDVFLGAFYRSLFESGRPAAAVLAGRREMLQDNAKYGDFPLYDWLLPVLYQQDLAPFSFSQWTGEATARASLLSEGAKDLQGFLGRDDAFLELERALRREPSAIVIHGMAGVGKTLLVRAFLRWLDQTGGLAYPPLWFSFQEIHSAEQVLKRLEDVLFVRQSAVLGGESREESVAEKFAHLAGALRESRRLIVWDSFEWASGISGTSINANLSSTDRKLLALFLSELRGGAGKVIITSRSSEDWLGSLRGFPLPLDGLDRAERWQHCFNILRESNLTQKISPKNKDLEKLMKALDGHPHAMRVILSQLRDMPPGRLSAAWWPNPAPLEMERDADHRRLREPLGFVEQALPEELHPWLTPLALHDGIVDIALLDEMAVKVDEAGSMETGGRLLRILVIAGLLGPTGKETYKMHPLLAAYLRSRKFVNVSPASREAWGRAFVDVMETVATGAAPDDFEERAPLPPHGRNFYSALAEAQRLQMPDAQMRLTQSLVAFARSNKNFGEAERLLQSLAEQFRSNGQRNYEAVTYYELGKNAHRQTDHNGAAEWYRKSLLIEEKYGEENVAHKNYHGLGAIAYWRKDLASAEDWFRKSLAVSEKLGDKYWAKRNYYFMAEIAEHHADFEAADGWLRKDLASSEEQGDWGIVGVICERAAKSAAKLGHRMAEAEWRIKSIVAKRRLQYSYSAEIEVRKFVECYESASPQDRERLKAMWQEAGFGDVPDWPSRKLPRNGLMGNVMAAIGRFFGSTER
jgi:tetratricopeptide (TPR) repeat protein